MCDLAKQLPLLVGGILEREKLLKRGRFREETMTDIFTGALVAFAGRNLVIEYPVEIDTGGDIDLRFWHVASGRSLNVRIQAKRLNAATSGKNLVKTKHRAYDELLHKSPTAKDYQFRVLRNSPAPWIPLYMFYNHESITRDREYAGKLPAVSGINLAFAHDVARELEEKLTAQAGNPRKIKHHKRLGHLRKHFFGLEAILCPAGNWHGEDVPSPELVQSSLRERYKLADDGAVRGDDAERVLRYLSEPASLTRFDTGGRLLDGPSIRLRQPVDVPTITFISGRTEDERALLIPEEPGAS